MTLDEKRKRAKEWLGTRWVLHPNYQPRLPEHSSTWEMFRPMYKRGKGKQ